jgi:chloramphenicol-sensitive protein RarD
LIWGLLPLFLKQVSFASPWEILGQRVLWSIPAAAGAVALFGGFAAAFAAFREKGVLRALALSSVLIAANWTIFVWAVANDRVIEGSLAYFLSPLITVAVGVLVFKEQLKGLQLPALIVAAIGVILQGVAIGHVPWVSLSLCASWVAYGVIRKQAPVPAAAGLLAETAFLAVPAAVVLALLARQGPGLAIADSSAHAGLLVLLGPLTAAPLILFALAARRVSFVALGVLQYVGPTLQLLTGLAYGESFGPLRAASFGLIWAGLAFFTWETVFAKARS